MTGDDLVVRVGAVLLWLMIGIPIAAATDPDGPPYRRKFSAAESMAVVAFWPLIFLILALKGVGELALRVTSTREDNE